MSLTLPPTAGEVGWVGTYAPRAAARQNMQFVFSIIVPEARSVSEPPGRVLGLG